MAAKLTSDSENMITTKAAAAAKPAAPARAYVTFLAGDGSSSCLKGVVELARALRRVGLAYPLVVAVLPDVPESIRRILVSQEGCVVREVQPVHPPENQQANFVMAYNATDHSKLRVWELVEYEKMVFLDPGVQVLRNIDHLFELDMGNLCVPTAGSSFPGVFVIEPRVATAQALLDAPRAAPRTHFAFAGAQLGDGDYDIEKALGMHLPRRLRFSGAGGDLGTGRTATSSIGGIFRYWATKLGFFATVVAVGAAVHCHHAGAALLLFLFLLAVAGVNLLTAALCLTDAVAAQILRKAAASARENVAVLAVSAASAAGTGIMIGGAAHPVFCFVCFALLLLAMSLAGLARN